MNKYNKWKSNFIELEINKDNEKEIEKLCHISIDMLNEETKIIRIYKDNLGGYIEKLKNNNYLLLIDRSYFEDSNVEKLEKMLYQFYKDENLLEYIEQYNSNSGCELEDVTDEFYNEKGELKQ
tara:strand:- start:98 stop:466 length:369 start_codon:yes stop_codon:yes gene_type:complete